MTNDNPLVLLHGGGDAPTARASTFGRMAQAFLAGGDGPLLIVAAATEAEDAQETIDYYGELFMALAVPAERLQPIWVRPDRPLTGAQVAEFTPAGLFVCGGATPVYHAALCADLSWVEYVRGRRVPYGGTSAGAAMAATRAIVGGWQTGDGAARPMIFAGAGEGLDVLTVRPGAGLVPFAVDVHAGQMGTLTRLIQAVAGGLTDEGWAIDEDTLLVVQGTRLEVAGRGHAYRVVRLGVGEVRLEILAAPMEYYSG